MVCGHLVVQVHLLNWMKKSLKYLFISSWNNANYNEYIIGKNVSCTKYGSGDVLETK